MLETSKSLTAKEIDIITMFDDLVNTNQITKERAEHLVNERLDDIYNDDKEFEDCLEAAFRELRGL